MILINPVHKIVNNAVRTDYPLNLDFARKLYTALTAKGEECLLPLDSEGAYLSDTAYSKLFTNDKFSVIFNIVCLYDISIATSGYSIECDKCNALVIAISDELTNWGASSIYPLGYKTSISTTPAEYTEITIGLGFITNIADNARITSSESQQKLVDRIVAAAYAAPSRNTQPDDNIGVADPYFYDTESWLLDTSTTIIGDNTSVLDSSIDSIPIKLLNVKTPDNVEDDPLTEGIDETITRATPLRWYTSISNDLWACNVLVIYSYKFNKSSGSLVVQVNDSDTAISTHTYEDSKWHTTSFKTTIVNSNSMLNLYYAAGSDIDVTAVWISKAAVIGTVDDPLSKYSIYPPEYAPITTLATDTIAAYNGSVSTATTLLGKALDTLTAAATIVDISTALSKLDQVPINTDSCVKAASDGTLAVAKMSGGKLTSSDLNKIVVDYALLQTALSYVRRSDKKAAMMNAVNAMKGIEKAKNEAMKTDADKKTEASTVSESVRNRAATQSEELGMV